MARKSSASMMWLSGVFIAGVLVIAGAIWIAPTVGLASYASSAEREVRQNPVARVIDDSTRNWDEWTNLTPSVFQTGQLRDEVEGLLAVGSFEASPDETRIAGSDRVIGSDEEAYVWFHSDGICRHGYYVVLKFDHHGKLVSAEGSKQERGCL